MQPDPARGPGDAREDGELEVDVRSGSYFLEANVPFEIRDAHHRLVGRRRGSQRVPLAKGLYSVDAVLPSGQRTKAIVRIEPGARTRLELGEESPAAAPEAPYASDRTGDHTTGDHTMGLLGATAWIVESGGRGPQPDLPGPLEKAHGFAGPHGVEIEVDELVGCRLHASSTGSWIFEPTPGLDRTPTASFAWADGRAEVSLPLNPTSDYPLCACIVDVVSQDPVRLRTRFAPERRVARAMDAMERSGDLVRGREVLQEATQLLLGKYQDPPAAAFGGLTLHRIGHLEERSAWVDNLARDFAWLPDGRVLLAALLSRREATSERERGLSLLLSASEQRPVFTDGLALLLDLLRRWPDETGAGPRHDRLRALASRPASTDWSATALTTYEPRDDA